MQANKRLLLAVAAVLVVLTAVLIVHFHAVPLIAIGTAYKAKTLCSGVFVSQRDAQSILDTDLSADDLRPLRWIDVRIDRDSRQVTADFLGVLRREARFRPGLGCTIVYRDAPVAPVVVPTAGESTALPIGPGALNEVLDWAFAEPDPSRLRRTRAVLIVHKGKIVGERYAEGFTKDTPLPG